MLLTHAGPGVGVNRISAADGRAGIRHQLNLGAGSLSDLPGVCDNLRAGCKASGCGDSNRRPKTSTGEKQRVRDIVAIAHISKADVREVTEPLPEGEVIGQRLARMLQIAESINYGDRRVLRHAFNRILCERAQHDGIHPAFEIVRYVTKLLSRIDSTMSLVDKKGSSAQAGHPGLERKPGTKRGLLKEHH